MSRSTPRTARGSARARTRFSLPQPATSGQPSVLYSAGKRRYDDDDDSSSSGSSDTSGSSESDSESGRSNGGDRGERRHHRRDAQGGISPVVLVLGVLLVAEVAAASYFATHSSPVVDAADSSSATSSHVTTSASPSHSPSTRATASATGSATASKPGGGMDSGPKASSGGDDDDVSSAPSASADGTGKGGGDSSPSSSADSSAPAPTSSTTDDPFANDCLEAHSSFRATHHADALEWNATLADAASRWVDNGVFEHSGGSLLPSSYGENLYVVGPVSKDATMDCKNGVESWNNEEKDYTYSPPTGFSNVTGHFTQVIWKETTQLGCSMKAVEGVMGTAGELDAYLVCEYSRAGNVGWSGEGDPNKS